MTTATIIELSRGTAHRHALAARHPRRTADPVGPSAPHPNRIVPPDRSLN